jgi:hypothetical protein
MLLLGVKPVFVTVTVIAVFPILLVSITAVLVSVCLLLGCKWVVQV